MALNYLEQFNLNFAHLHSVMSSASTAVFSSSLFSSFSLPLLRWFDLSNCGQTVLSVWLPCHPRFVSVNLFPLSLSLSAKQSNSIFTSRKRFAWETVVLLMVATLHLPHQTQLSQSVCLCPFPQSSLNCSVCSVVVAAHLLCRHAAAASPPKKVSTPSAQSSTWWFRLTFVRKVIACQFTWPWLELLTQWKPSFRCLLSLHPYNH